VSGRSIEGLNEKVKSTGQGQAQGNFQRFRLVGSGKRERRGKEARGEEDVKNIAGEKEDRKRVRERKGHGQARGERERAGKKKKI
jgi:hypothetical protein